MNRFWLKVLICLLVIAGGITFLAWPRYLPPPDEKNRVWSPGGMSMITPPDWEGLPILPDHMFDDGLMLRPKADGRRQPSITARRYQSTPDMDTITSRRDKSVIETTFNGYPGYLIEGETNKDFLFRYVFNAGGKWHQLILSSPLPLDFEGSDWQQYLKTFRAAKGSATTEPSTTRSSSSPS